MRRYLQLAVGISLSGFFLYLALRGEDWTAIGAEFTGARYQYLLPMVISGVYALYVRSQRWQLLLERATGTTHAMGPIFSASAIGFMASNILPFRIGEVARPYLVSRRTDITMSTALATVVIERVLDLLVLFAFAAATVGLADVPAVVRNLMWLAGAVALVAAGVTILLHLGRERLVPPLDRVWRKLPNSIGRRLIRLEHDFLDGISTIAEPLCFLKAVAWSFYIWVVIALCFSFGFLATGLDIPFLGGGIAVTTLVALAVSIPSAPAFVGQFEWGCKLALESIFAVEGARAVGYSILTHATQFLTQVALGLVYLVREGLSFGDLGRIETGGRD